MGTDDLSANLLDELLDAVLMVDAGGTIRYASAAWERILGYTPQELTGRTLRDFIAPDDLARTLAEADEIMAGKARIGFENRYVRKDGTLVHLMWSARHAPEHGMRIGVARDVSALKRADDLRAATYAISEAGQRADNLDALFRDIGRIVGRLVPMDHCAFARPDLDRGHYVQTFPADDVYGIAAQLLETPYPLQDVVRGDWLLLPLTVASRHVGAMLLQGPPGVTLNDTDIALLQFVAMQAAMAIERLELHTELLHAARYDDLTDLPNRRRFTEQVEHALVRTMRSGGTLALLFIDVNDFKLINDRLGHAAGDHVLRTLAQRMRETLREEDSVSRLGGDEFAVLLDQVADLAAAHAVAAKLRLAAGAPLVCEGHMLTVRLSIGIAAAPDHGYSLDQLLRHADQAMYLEKQQRKLLEQG
jgi:diguanylate cyclase (GGDEF)-like protein/PAS domain S-box-containing protein